MASPLPSAPAQPPKTTLPESRFGQPPSPSLSIRFLHRLRSGFFLRSLLLQGRSRFRRPPRCVELQRRRRLCDLLRRRPPARLRRLPRCVRLRRRLAQLSHSLLLRVRLRRRQPSLASSQTIKLVLRRDDDGWIMKMQARGIGRARIGCQGTTSRALNKSS